MVAKRRLLQILTVACTLSLARAGLALVGAGAEGGALPPFDARVSRGQELAAFALEAVGGSSKDLLGGRTAEPGEIRRAALLGLERSSGRALSVAWDPITGSPRLVAPRRGFLSGADPRPPETVARDFLLAHRDLFLLDEAEVLGLRVTDVAPIPGGGAVVWLEQEVDGLLVDQSLASVALTGEGRVLALSGGRTRGLAGWRPPAARMTAGQAFKALARHAGVELAQVPAPAEEQPRSSRFEHRAFANSPVAVRQVVVPTVHGFRLGWSSRLDPVSPSEYYDVVLDDATGLLVRRVNLVRFADTRGRVFVESPSAGPHDLVRFVDTEDYRSDESPWGWALADVTEGNNAIVREDVDANDENPPGRMAQAAPPPPYLAFDFPFTGDPSVDVDASITQLFYGLNLAHDHFYRLGFDEASGNYQVENGSNPGLGGDPILGDALDGFMVNGTQYSPAPEGFPARITATIIDLSGEDRDSAFDVGVILHEYSHGVSVRLVGGPSRIGCLGFGQDGAMGEGWGDYFAASYFDDPVIAAWVAGDTNVGIRNYRLDDNPPNEKTYAQYCQGARDQPDFMQCEVHDNGEIWSGFLWRLREEMIAARGPEGSDLADRMILEALKLTPCLPTMPEAVLAIVLADRALNAGAHECLIKSAAAERGLGFGASSAGTLDSTPTASTQDWPECQTGGRVGFTRDGLEPGQVTAYACMDEVQVSVVDGDALAPVRVVITVPTSPESETVDLVAQADPAVYLSTPLPIDTGGGISPENGVLEVQPGEMLVVTYDDGGTPRTAEATIDCTARIDILRHRFSASTCDEDVVDGFPDLPGFLDEGESADLTLTLANHMPAAVTGLVQVTTDRPDLFTVLPQAAPLPVDLPPAVGSTPGLDAVTVRVAAVDSFGGATAANVLVNLLAPGYDATVDYILPLELNLDYEVETDLTLSDDIEGEVAPVGPQWTTGPAAGPNQWTVVSCSAVSGTQSYRNGPTTNCNGNYSDDQADPWLSAPVLDFGSDPTTAAVRLTNVSFQHDVNLGVDGLFGFDVFDADAVGLVVVNDPAAVDTSNPLALADSALWAWADLSIIGLTGNTTGWAPFDRPIQPGELQGVDLLRPAYLTWFFLPDITPSEYMGFPFNAQGRGFFIDDLVVTYDRVRKVAQGSPCTAGATPFSFPVIVEPASGVGCAGDAVLVDASASDAANCGAVSQLEYRFLVGGVPVACFDDDLGTVPRTQDPDGWGLTPLCHDFPDADTTYDVEVRCALFPDVTDVRPATTRVIDGTPIVEASPAAFCAASPVDAALDASASAFVACDGDVLYLYRDAAGAPIDCDGDGLTDPSPDPTCTLPASTTDVTVGLELSCSTVPGCAISDAFTIPAIVIDPVAEEVAPPAFPYCPGESSVMVSAARSAVTGCAGGELQYRWTAAGGFDTGWVRDSGASIPVPAAGALDAEVEVRCSLAPGCTAPAALPPVTVRGLGGHSLLTVPDPPDPDACAGDPLELAIRQDAAMDCSGTLVYRFLADGALLDCDGDGAPDDFGSAATAAGTCATVHVDGGADFTAEVACDDDPTCESATAAVRVTPRVGVPTGEPQGTLRVSKRGGDCPVPGDVLLAWLDSGRTPQSFFVMRSDDPAALQEHAPVDGLTHDDTDALCLRLTPYRGVDVLFYRIWDRDQCTDRAIPDR